ncbi:RNA-directed DNA polymerase, eukaryota, reverse transcriptase zinc-binding domain protein [Tanacetum coccineum]
MKKAFKDMLHELGEVNLTHAYYNGSRTSQDKEDPSWSTSFKTRRQRRHLQHWKRLGCHFTLLYLYLLETLGKLRQLLNGDYQDGLQIANMDRMTFHNRRDLPRDIPLDSVVVLRYEKRRKSENKGLVPTEMEPVLEQTQQEHQSDTQVITVKMEILLERTSKQDHVNSEGLAECKASARNLRRIQVKDIIKEVKDYLKTYSSAGMDMSFAKKLKQGYEEMALKIKYVPDAVSKLDNGNRRIEFTDEEVIKGGMDCSLQLYGYFVGTSMDYRVVRANLMRMWRVYDIEDIRKTNSRVYYFNCKREEGMKYVLESGPWMVQNVPMLFVFTTLFKSLLIKVMDQGNMDDVINIQEEFDNIVWPNLKSEVDILMEYHLDPSDDDVESKVDGIVADMKPKFEIDVANEVENVATIDNNVSNGMFLEIRSGFPIMLLVTKSSGGSKVTTIMSDFRDCISDIEIEDIAISGMSYTWNKSLGKVGGLLKKLDRLVLLENFNENYSKCLRLLVKLQLLSTKLLMLEEVTTASGINAAEGVNAASKEVSIAELVSIAYVLSKEFNLLKWDQQVVSELVEKL